ncbi:amidase family protein [Pseudovibrio denitrificans]|uniref:amidase family protein n=1 Tax=Pseudovibrio denitrificans TaxID=258256 RepID=UPI0039BFF9C0
MVVDDVEGLWERLEGEELRGVFIGLNRELVEELVVAAQVRRASGEKLSAIDGELVAIKGNIALKGRETTAGSVAYSTEVEDEHALVVQRVIEAGGIPIGPANLAEFAYTGIGLNPHYGNAPNGLDRARVPGGSSSGSAAAISNGVCDLAIGSDTSGSTRVPAAFQGICGYRATMGRYPMEGVVPLGASLDVLGPMARTVEGICALDAVMCGKHSSHDTTAEERAFRLVVPDLDGLGISAEIMEMFEHSIDMLSAAGIQIVRRDLRPILKAHLLFAEHGTLVSVEAREQIAQYVDVSKDKIDPQIKARLERALPMTPKKLAYLRRQRAVLQSEIEVQLKGDLLLMPTVPDVPPLISEVEESVEAFQEANALALRLTMITAFLNMPSLALPVDLEKPSHSISICGAAAQDELVLAAGCAVERVLR